MTKQEIRKEIRQKRLNFSNSDRVNESIKVTEKLLSLECVKNAKTIHVYIDQDGEITTRDFILSLKNKEIYTPSEDRKNISHRKIEVVNEEIVLSKELYENIDCDVVVCPGIAFTTDGKRLGYGGGYYDKFLENKKCHKIGICFSCQIVKNLPKNQYDIDMDEVIIL